MFSYGVLVPAPPPRGLYLPRGRALHETGDRDTPTDIAPEAVIGKIAGRRIEGSRGTLVVCG